MKRLEARIVALERAIKFEARVAPLERVLAKLAKPQLVIVAAWIGFVGVYALVSMTLPRGSALTAFGDIAQALAAAFACVCLIMNAPSEERRTRAFWLLLGLGCATWFVGQLLWTYFEVVRGQEAPNPFIGDVILFLHPVPMMWALALKPHDRRDDPNFHIGYLDFSLLLVWWVYLYLFVVIPWQYISPDVAAYGLSYDHLAAVENGLLAIGFAVLVGQSSGVWREVYAHLFSASLLYAGGSYLANWAIDRQDYYTGSPFDLPVIASFVWFGTAGIVAYYRKPGRDYSRASPGRGEPLARAHRDDGRRLHSADGAMESAVQPEPRDGANLPHRADTSDAARRLRPRVLAPARGRPRPHPPARSFARFPREFETHPGANDSDGKARLDRPTGSRRSSRDQ